jgi:hypothetical protein
MVAPATDHNIGRSDLPSAGARAHHRAGVRSPYWRWCGARSSIPHDDADAAEQGTGADRRFAPAAHCQDVLATRCCPSKLSPFGKGVEAETTCSTR